VLIGGLLSLKEVVTKYKKLTRKGSKVARRYAEFSAEEEMN